MNNDNETALSISPLSVYQIVGSPYCVGSSDGEKVYKLVQQEMNRGKMVVLSFLNVELLTSAFLNSAIGQIYGHLTETEVRERLKVTDIQQEDLGLLKRVVDTAKLYFANPHEFEQVIREAPGSYGDGE